MRKNYIETTHEYVDKNGDAYRDVLSAVNTSPSQYKFKGDEEWDTFGGDDSWLLEGGQPIRLYIKEEIDGLRKLLDEIEKAMDSE